MGSRAHLVLFFIWVFSGEPDDFGEHVSRHKNPVVVLHEIIIIFG
jgi:hypothetical protein